MEQPDTDSARRFEEVKLISEQIASMIEAIDRINTLGHRQEHRKIQAELAFLYPQLVKLHLSVRSKLYVQDFADIATQEHLDHFREQFAASAVIFSELEEIDTTGELKKWCERKTHEEQRVAIERVKVAIRGDDAIGLRGNRAIAELVVVGIRRDHREAKMRFDKKDVCVEIK